MSTAIKKDHQLERPSRGGTATFVEAIRQGIWEEMERDPTVFCIGEDVGVYGGAFKVTDGLYQTFGKDRVIDTPISEAAIVDAACGAALLGMRPVAEFQFIDFISAGFDLLTNYAAKCRYRWGAGIPAVFRLPRLRAELPADDYIVEIGKARTARAGRDLSIITFGAMVLTALDAAEELEKEGLDVEVIDLRTLAPLDKETILASVKKTSKALVLHEASRTGGIGGEIAATIAEEAFEWLDAPVVRLASIDTPVPYSPPLEDYYLPQAKDVLDAARKLAAY